MKEGLEYLFTDADKMLAEHKEKEQSCILCSTSWGEAGNDAVARFNAAPFEPKLVFWRRHPRVAGLLTLLTMAMIAARIYIAATMPCAVGHYSLAMGIVESSNFSSRMRGYGAHLATSRVLLPNGNIIAVRVDSGEILPQGTAIPIRIYDTGAVRLDHEK